MLNSVLLSSANKVVKSTRPTQFRVSAHFISAAQGSKFSFYPLQGMLKDITINRNYADNYADEIDINMTVSPKDYALMQDQGEDLLCVLTITYADKYGKDVFDPKPIQVQYHALINDARDIRKALPDVHKYTEPSLPISLRLIEESVYKLRHTKINSIFPTMDMKQVIYSIASTFGIERIHLVDPDNTHKYDHVVVGSYQSIKSVFNYLQATCGVYTKGINSYIQDGCLYIYPPFETDPQYDKTTLFYQVDTGRYSGSHTYHDVKDKTLSIVINSQPVSHDLSIAGSENHGTGFVFNRASRLADGFTTIDGNDGAKFTLEPALTVVLSAARTLVKGLNNLLHIHATDNPFPQMSELISHQASLMDVSWPNADPFIMDPCQKLVFYYDKNGAMVQKTGIMERAMYKITRMQRTDSRDIFACGAQLILRLAPNETNVV